MLETSNGTFFVSYAESSLTCKFELNTAILNFERFEVSKNPIFGFSSQRDQMLRSVLVALREGYPENLKLIRRF